MAKKRKKKELPIKQKKTIAKMKKTRQIDSNNLRQLILAKKTWTINEIKRGKQQQRDIQVTINKLEGILAFIQDLTEPENLEK